MKVECYCYWNRTTAYLREAVIENAVKVGCRCYCLNSCQSTMAATSTSSNFEVKWSCLHSSFIELAVVIRTVIEVVSYFDWCLHQGRRSQLPPRRVLPRQTYFLQSLSVSDLHFAMIRNFSYLCLLEILIETVEWAFLFLSGTSRVLSWIHMTCCLLSAL